jgi:hypothetical protein
MMIARSAGAAQSSNAIPSASTKAALSPLAVEADASARAIPIETAVAATAVDSASAAVVINSTKATDLCLAAHVCRPSGSVSVTGVHILDISAPRISSQPGGEIRGRCGRLFDRNLAKALMKQGVFMF